MSNLLNNWRNLTLVRRIELGGMADLHVALTPDHVRLVLKRLREEYRSQRRIRKQFMNGAEILGELNHPSIIQFVEGGIDEDNAPYLLLEYFESKNLRQLIHTRDPILKSHLRLILIQLAEGVEYLHQTGYLHFDLKPENILVNEYGDLRIIDFDLSMPRAKKPVKVREISGTPAYMAPEVLALHKVDELTDIFSFGVISYEILTSQKPYPAYARPGPRYRSHIQADLTDAGASTPLARIISKCLDPEPSARYPAMSLALKELKKSI